MAVRRVEGWCEMAFSLRGCEMVAEEGPQLEDVIKQSSEDCD
jgi:hypothetical protein